MKYFLIVLFLVCFCKQEKVKSKYDIYEPDIRELNNYCNIYGFDKYHGKFKYYIGNEIVCELETFPDGTPVWKSKKYYSENLE